MAVLKAQADSTILITGTPISNRLSEFGGLLTIGWDPHWEGDGEDVFEGVDDHQKYADAFIKMTLEFKGIGLTEKLSADHFS